MDWGSSNLSEAWLHFKDHEDLIFKGPLKNKSEEDKAHIYYCGLFRDDEKYTKHRIFHRTKTKS
ncbi:hypothetical protein DPMN_160547 [Dreissena polymorpha]|uniref:Uncharacterized protein n=1 Tax=Dreissena polymorpha TaxID=45954 RepID=A0A9D4ISM8_DREPO|nr:hypothetical protein DPMN_160547 [Dreissena polymorpha]